ncbi:response regulator [Oerskovia flava]|uniref:response regulator n=1 Tax=Oerskovia flava TaxID=2986422 RepID=UPI00223EF766|nr:response regulator transcription factor [Oerskovia sp. JB1-3-2]
MGEAGSSARRRVLVVDDHRILTDLIAAALDAEDDLECVGVADDRERALALAATLHPDTVVLDVQLPGDDGLEVLRALREADPDVRVVMLTAHPRPDLERAALEHGACGFLAKDGRLTALLEAVRSASPARPARDPGLVRRSATAHETWHLTPRELEVLTLLGEGADVRTIAVRLGLSVHTVRDHVKAVLAKLGVRSQLEAVTAAHGAGIIRVGGR